MKKIFLILLLFVSGCKEGKNLLIPEFKETPILEIKEMPKETFLRFVEESVDLTDEEKKTIRKNIDPTVYTHARLAKHQQNEEIFLEIDQYYPSKLIGEDSAGHPQVIGGSGTISVYKLENELWRLVADMHYDGKIDHGEN